GPTHGSTGPRRSRRWSMRSTAHLRNDPDHERLMPRLLFRTSGLSLGLLVLLGAAVQTSGFDDKDNPQSPVDVYEWSIWVGNPAQKTLNTTRLYKSAMPSSVGTSRPNLEEKERAIKFSIAPISVVQFFGDPCRDVDIDLRTK